MVQDSDNEAPAAKPISGIASGKATDNEKKDELQVEDIDDISEIVEVKPQAKQHSKDPAKN
jgi:hypothetical protein